MTFNQFIKEVNKYFKISEEQIKKIIKYKEFLQQENKKYNLTRLDKEDIIYSDYFLESILPYFYSSIDFKNKQILDIGSGSGIPGVLIAIFFKSSQVTLLESNNKKCIFLKELIIKLNLNNVTVINDRAENFVKNNYESFDIVTSRAVSDLRKILEISTGFCKVNGLLLEPKSKKWETELLEANNIIKELDISLQDNIEYLFNNKQFNLLIFKKNKITNRKYPRSWNVILKG